MANTKKRKILEYNAVFQAEKDGGYSVWVPALPGCTSQGETFDEAMRGIREAIGLYLEDNEACLKNQDEKGVRQFLIPVTYQYA
jgi:predicted RNase H-like HicB family nuclease